MANHNDATLEELCDLLAQSTGIRVSRVCEMASNQLGRLLRSQKELWLYFSLVLV